MQKIIPPIHCPSCLYELEWKKDILYCVNPKCHAQALKALEHWAKTLKIKGLGPATILKLEIDSVVKLYQLSYEHIKGALGSEKIAIKVYEEIQKSKEASLNRVLPSFSVPLIGNSATEKLSSTILTLDDLTDQKCKEAGLGPKATLNLMQWFNTKYKNEIKGNLTFNPKMERREETQIKGLVCISGKLSSVKTKAVAEKLLEASGYKVKSSLTKDVTILLNESGKASAKTTKAQEMGITIVENLNELLEN